MQLPNDLVLEFDAYETIDRYGREYTANPIFLWTKDLKQGSNYVSEDGKTYRIEAKSPTRYQDRRGGSYPVLFDQIT
jgi:hypothetical protein